MAREKLPDVPLEIGDLVDFQLEPPAQAITCLFSAIGHVFPEERLQASARCIARSLAPGGLALVEPWITPDVFVPDTVGFHAAVDEVPKLARMTTTRREGAMTLIDAHWMVGYPDRVERFEERYEVWMATPEQLLGAFREAGLDARWDDPGPMGRGQILARK